ncbi:MAG TPA: DUF11 domain-containing protein [Pyrinomonadaceae bacterium]
MATKNVESLVLVGKGNGLVIIPAKSPLTRLNYFDGKFLRASDLKSEQDYVRQLVRLSNQAGGSGVVHGFDLTLGGGDTLDLGPGLGINPDGRVLLLPQDVSIGIQELIDKSQKLQTFDNGKKGATDVFGDCVMAGDAPPVNASHPNDLYLIVVSPAEALCGEEDVYGKLCEEACSTSTDRPFAIEGIIVRAIPLMLRTPLPQSKAVSITSKLHLRSRVASAYFEDERQRVAGMISKFGLAQQVWCLGADAASGNGLPIGVIARAGGTTVFLDPWIARRERMDTPPRRYWQWRMMMRPWDVFLAQILQFQCQLRDLFDGVTPGQDDPCGDARTVIGEAAKKLADFIKAQKDSPFQFASTADGVSSEEMFKAKLIELESMSQKLTATEAQMQVTTGNRLLLRNGFVELPSAGYLPVSPEAKMSVEDQVRQLMGEGVDLRFCIVRADFVAHALEEAQHMERISLIQGLEDPKQKPRVDILIPDGELAAQTVTRTAFAVDAKLQSKFTAVRGEEEVSQSTPADSFKGVARAEKLSSGGTAFYFASSSPAATSPLFLSGAQTFGTFDGVAQPPAPKTVPIGIWLSLRSEDDLLALKPGDKTDVIGEVVMASGPQNAADLRYRGEIKGELTINTSNQPQFPVEGKLAASFTQESSSNPAQSGTDESEFFAKQQGPSIEMRLNVEAVSFQINANWTNPDKVQADLKTDVRLTERFLLEIDLTSALNKDENVFNATDSNHVLAVDALKLAGAALKQADFVARKSELLFPAAPAASTAIRARRDWVLFHRRRDKDCGGGVAVTTRRYQVYELLVPAGTDAANTVPKQPPTADEILKTPPEFFKRFLPLGIATFSDSSLVGDHAALKSAWQKAAGASILWSAIANEDAAAKDGDSLALARLATLRSELDQVSPDARADVLPVVPPPLAMPDTDGVIVFIVGSIEVSADLAISQTAGFIRTGNARTITYELTAINNGPGAAKDVAIDNGIPQNTTFLSADVITGTGWNKAAPNVGVGGAVTFSKASVANGEKAVFRIVVTLSPNMTGGTITNTATIKSSNTDPVSSNNSDTEVINLSSPPPPLPPP